MLVANLENKNQIITINDQKTKFNFYSYGVKIAEFNKESETLKVGKKFDYSRTTLKHLYIFIENISNYYAQLLANESGTRKDRIESLIAQKKIIYKKDMI